MNQTITHVVVALIFKDNQLCIGQRLREPFKGFFECPGGKVEPGETLIEGLKRELYEEGLIHVDEATYLTHYPVHTVQGHLILHWFKVETKDEFAKIIYDDLRWVDFAQLSQLEWIEHNRPYLPMIEHAYALPEKSFVFTCMDSCEFDRLKDEMISVFKDAGFYKKSVRLVLSEDVRAQLDADFLTFLKLYPIELES